MFICLVELREQLKQANDLLKGEFYIDLYGNVYTAKTDHNFNLVELNSLLG
jgi:hypothetical protein